MILFDYRAGVIYDYYTLQGSELETVYNYEGNEIPDSNFSIKVMEYNVGQWYLGNHDNVPVELDEIYYELQNGMIGNANADILFLCEYVKEFSKTGRTAVSILSEYFPYIYERAGTSTTSGVQCCICSKYPINNWKHNIYHEDSGLYYDSCDVIVNGVPMKLIITHLHWDSRQLRIEELGILMNYIKDFPNFILAGDFNTAATSINDTDYPLIIVPLINAGYHVANANGNIFIPTYNASTDKCLDNIVTSGNMIISNVYVDDTKKIDDIDEKVDHMPLIATIMVGIKP